MAFALAMAIGLGPALASSVPAPATSAIGMAFQVGADYMITDNIMINGQVRYIDIDTQATVENNAVAPGTRAKVNVEVDPFIYMVGLGYKF